MSDSKPTITLKPNGPILVKGLHDLSDSRGAVETSPVMALCRCGESANKPFCDGTHSRVGFSSEKEPDRRPDRQDVYQGKEITVFDNRGACAHAGFCTEGLPGVFRLREEPFVNPDGAAAEETAAVIRRCPSGALRHANAGSEETSGGGSPGIFVAKNGPYVVAGDPELEGVERPAGVSDRFTLCRCGHSKNKPFCDGSHWSVEFDDDKS